jgi:hypothetical protein
MNAFRLFFFKYLKQHHENNLIFRRKRRGSQQYKSNFDALSIMKTKEMAAQLELKYII